jgi:hypothetical protein
LQRNTVAISVGYVVCTTLLLYTHVIFRNHMGCNTRCVFQSRDATLLCPSCAFIVFVSKIARLN